MKYLFTLLSKARRSKFSLFLLNYLLGYSIPFNKPHRIKITAVKDNGISMLLPYRRSNLNHLKGIHACALATTAEYTSGMAIIMTVGTGYRLIMKNINVTYHYQAKMDVVTSVEFEKDQLDKYIFTPLHTSDAVLFNNTVEVHDLLANHICTARIEWQIKKWDKVLAR